MEQSVDVCVDVLGAGAGSAGSEVLLAVAWCCLAPCAVGQRLGLLPASLSDLPFFLLVGDQAARTQQLQAGEGEMKQHQQVHVSKRESERGRMAARLPAVVGLAWGLP